MIKLKSVPALIRRTVLAAMLSGAASLHGAGVQIEFLPPPMEGTISLGIYNAEGKLVRTLHREAEMEEFKMALNGLVTRWDGKNDAGEVCPNGNYFARGYMVGGLDIEGIRFHGNEWMSVDDAPRIRRITRLHQATEETAWLEALVPGSEQPQVFRAVPDEGTDWKLIAEASLPAEVATEGLGMKLRSPALEASKIVSGPVKSPAGEQVLWAIVGTSLHQVGLKEGSEVPEGASLASVLEKGEAEGEILDTIPLEKPEDPTPRQLALSATAQTLVVLDEAADAQRLWALRLETPRTEPGDAEALFVKNIHFSETLEQAQPMLKFSNGKPFAPVDALPVVPVPNPLLKETPPAIRLKVGVDQAGTFLATEDGLKLQYISDTPHLRWAAIGRSLDGGRKSVAIFESDGAVVAEFRAKGLANMMAFDAGKLKWKAAAKAEPLVSGEGEATDVPASATPEPEAVP